MVKSSFSKHTSDKIVSSLALLCVGVCLAVWAEAVTDWIAVTLGVLALLYAVAGIIRFVRARSSERTTGALFFIILSFAAGLLLVTRTDFVKNAISFIIGFYIVLTSATQFLNIHDLRSRLKEKVGSYFWPVVGMTVGFLCLTGQFIVPDQLARLTGIVLIIYAIVYLIGALTIRKRRDEVKKEINRAFGIQEAEIIKTSSKPKKSTKSSTKTSSNSSKKSKK